VSKTILIVDDSSTMRKIIIRSLRQANLKFDELMEAGDGQEALEVLSKTKIDLILSDINMPNMDGIAFLEAKAGTPQIRDIPIVMVTTEGGAEDMVAKCTALGAVGCVRKPFTPDQINAVLGPLL
jgi:two-component system chemotaxis response regulator CheY